MPAPKPITLTQVDAIDYEGNVPAPFILVGDIPELAPATDDQVAGYVDDTDSDTREAVDGAIEDYFADIAGYDALETQILTNVEGVLTWVTDES